MISRHGFDNSKPSAWRPTQTVPAREVSLIVQDIDYFAGGERHTAEVFAHAGAVSRPGILVFHDGGGPGLHSRERARRLAGAGYAVLAPDLFGVPAENRMHGSSMSQELAAMPARLRLRANAALEALKALPYVDPAKIAAIGFCFGGTAALELARSGADVACVVSFHGGLRTAQAAEPNLIRATILALAGVADPFVNVEQRNWFQMEMHRAQADWQLVVYANAKHSFTNPHLDPALYPGSEYNQRADRRSWRAMHDLFEEKFGARVSERSGA